MGLHSPEEMKQYKQFILENFFNFTTIKDLCNAAGVSRESFYWLLRNDEEFKSKYDEMVSQRWQATLDKSVDEADKLTDKLFDIAYNGTDTDKEKLKAIKVALDFIGKKYVKNLSDISNISFEFKDD